jgi:hypothetical protein
LAQLFDLDLLKAYLADDLASLNAGRAANAALNAILGSSGFVVGRDLHHGAELAKANFRQRRHEILCIEAHDITRGFHPRSDICGGCPLRDRCKAETAFRVAKERP